ncbi:MAG: succinylglutamate desuccinylase/aspartoacylase family protein [Bacteroidota bacterium]
MMHDQRLIGSYTGAEKGPLLLIFGGMHGNEPAGVQAMQLLFKMLEVEPITNPHFRFCGRLVGIRGNLRALQENTRFLDKDLNRQWIPEHIERIKSMDRKELKNEDLEILEVLDVIERERRHYQPDLTVVLDIHTTTAYGGIFSIATDEHESVQMAIELHAPVITGMLKGIKGTSLHYFNSQNFPPKTIPVVFEAGQHREALSVNRAIAAIINCMRTIGCVQSEDVENRHDSLLLEYSKGLPKVAELLSIHSIEAGDQFEMEPGYSNFQAVAKGELLAHDQHGPIYAEEDGLVLMPLYQKQGDDGYFLVREVAPEKWESKKQPQVAEK